jgi:hypothetical protein
MKQSDEAKISGAAAPMIGAGFMVMERWLGDNDLVFLRRDRADPMVVRCAAHQ